jgi:hypothetical protein
VQFAGVADDGWRRPTGGPWNVGGLDCFVDLRTPLAAAAFVNCGISPMAGSATSRRMKNAEAGNL